MEKINFINNVTKANADTFNTMQDNIENGINTKQDTLVSGTNIKTINGSSVLGSGNIQISAEVETDSEVSTSSTNPIQNQAITNYVNTMNAYSETEINTGKKWIDGKAIYRKVFSKSDLSNISTGLSALDTMIKMECLIKQATTGDWRNLPWLYNGGTSAWQGGFFFKNSDDTISFQVGLDLGSVQQVIVILEYTKTS